MVGWHAGGPSVGNIPLSNSAQALPLLRSTCAGHFNSVHGRGDDPVTCVFRPDSIKRSGGIRSLIPTGFDQRSGLSLIVGKPIGQRRGAVEGFAHLAHNAKRDVLLYTTAGHVATKHPGDYRSREDVERDIIPEPAR
jgi:hypothetical protein